MVEAELRSALEDHRPPRSLFRSFDCRPLGGVGVVQGAAPQIPTAFHAALVNCDDVVVSREVGK